MSGVFRFGGGKTFTFGGTAAAAAAAAPPPPPPPQPEQVKISTFGGFGGPRSSGEAPTVGGSSTDSSGRPSSSSTSSGDTFGRSSTSLTSEITITTTAASNYASNQSGGKEQAVYSSNGFSSSTWSSQGQASMTSQQQWAEVGVSGSQYSIQEDHDEMMDDDDEEYYEEEDEEEEDDDEDNVTPKPQAQSSTSTDTVMADDGQLQETRTINYADKYSTMRIEEEDDEDTDCDYESYTTSLSPSMVDYNWENGRRYHCFREGQYLLPNDDMEQDRLDLMHHIFRMVLNKKLHTAPLVNPERILDLGTGTGIWAIDMADEYPDAHITANDLSAIQPKKVPPNVTFELDDCESLWPYNKPFDFVHARTLTGAIQDWPGLYKQAFANLKPGGWMEATDVRLKTYCIDRIKPDAICRQLSTLFHQAVKMMGRQPDVAQLHKQMMIDAGFVNVQEKIVHIPQNPWPEDKNQKILGAYLMYSVIDAMPSYGIAALTRIIGMPRVEAEVLIAAAKNEVQDTRNRFYSIAHFVIGQKPME